MYNEKLYFYLDELKISFFFDIILFLNYYNCIGKKEYKKNIIFFRDVLYEFLIS